VERTRSTYGSAGFGRSGVLRELGLDYMQGCYVGRPAPLPLATIATTQLSPAA
jgi:hypothetical protein